MAVRGGRGAVDVGVDEDLVAFANELADAAGRVILEYWRSSEVAVISKQDVGRPVEESPVTIADRGAEAAMRDHSTPTNAREMTGEAFRQILVASF